MATLGAKSRLLCGCKGHLLWSHFLLLCPQAASLWLETSSGAALADLCGALPAPTPHCLAAPSPSVPTLRHPPTALGPWCRMPQTLGV